MAGRRRRLYSVCTVGLLGLVACSSSAHRAAAPNSASTPVQRGPVAAISGPVTGGKGLSLLSPKTVDLVAAGYQEREFFASGTARSFHAVAPLGNDGRWTVQAVGGAPYRTRIVVRAPRDPARFNGSVLVEWLNVTAGSDAPADFAYLAPEILRSGYAWVGVSAQQVGVMGGASVLPTAGLPTGGLRGTDPARYSTLQHPGDAYSFDMFSQIGRAIRVSVLGPVHVQHLLAVGESQSAFALTTYINAVQHDAQVFDGFFVHSRGGGAFPLEGGGLASAISGAVQIRDDLNVPVLLVETETDEMLLGYFKARQPDSARVRLWDIAGGSHADAYLLGPTVATALGCNGTINQAPTHFVLNAALHQLDRWVQTGAAPEPAPRMHVTIENGSPVVQRDQLGVALGGVRSAAIDVPVAAYSGVPADTSNVVCALFGSTHPFDGPTLRRLYPTTSAYLTAFTTATDKAIAAGHILAADRAEIVAEAGQARF